MLIVWLIVVTLLSLAALGLALARSRAAGFGLASLRRGVSELRGELAEMREALGRESAQPRAREDARIAELAAAQEETRRSLDALRERASERERELEKEREKERELEEAREAARREGESRTAYDSESDDDSISGDSVSDDDSLIGDSVSG